VKKRVRSCSSPRKQLRQVVLARLLLAIRILSKQTVGTNVLVNQIHEDLGVCAHWKTVQSLWGRFPSLDNDYKPILQSDVHDQSVCRFWTSKLCTSFLVAYSQQCIRRFESCESITNLPLKFLPCYMVDLLQ
jgi:hypothetical protein